MTPAMMRPFGYLLLCISFLCSIRMWASPQDDSLRIAIEGTSTARDRARSLLVMANAEKRTRPGESLVKVGMALRFAEQSGDRQLLLEAVRQQRDLERSAGAYDQFLLSAIRAVAISEQLTDRRALADDLRWLSEAYDRTGAYDQAVEISRKALFLLRTTGDSAAIGRGILDVMNALVHAGHFNEVLKQGEEALSYYERQGDSLGTALVLMTQGETLLRRGNAVDARTLLNKAERMFRENGDDGSLLRTLISLAQANIELKNWELARKRFDEATALQHITGAQQGASLLLHLGSRLEEGTGDMMKALAYQRQASAMEDSLFSERMAERMIGLQALYSARDKDALNSQLKVENEAYAGMLSSGRIRSRIWMTAMLLFGAAAAGFYLMARRMRRLTIRARLRNQVIQGQSEEIKAKNIELEQQNQRLIESLMDVEEKDVVLKEIHHRVKNNLQIVNTLLRLQGSHLNDPRLDVILGDCQGRVRSMALVHEHIYRCGDLNRVNVKAHVIALAEAVLKQYGLFGKVELDVTVSYDRATLDNLIPLSLLLNELLSNSAKHAFKDRDSGRISIMLRKISSEQCELVFSDDGIGMELNRFFESGSFGLELVRNLAAQLNGTIRLLKGEGTTLQMLFAPEERTLRKAS